MRIDDMGVVARLQVARGVETRNFDADHVLAVSHRAFLRHRFRQTVSVCLIVGLIVALALAGPIRVPGAGYVALPGSEQIRSLVGLETEWPQCTSADLTVEWGEISSRTVPVLFAGYVIEGATEVQSSRFDGQDPPSGNVSFSDLLQPEVARVLSIRAETHPAFDFSPRIDDGYGRLAQASKEARPDGKYVWWTASEMRSLPGVARCDGLPVTMGGEPSADITITSWNGTDSSGVVNCAAPPTHPSRVERQAASYCRFLD